MSDWSEICSESVNNVSKQVKKKKLIKVDSKKNRLLILSLEVPYGLNIVFFCDIYLKHPKFT